jgi:2-amino-4-hydroxy-6-hydroxymethyldihydropteridine diphosphokinase
MAETVYIGLGSNQGDQQGNLRRAVEAVARLPDTRVVEVSSIYKTEPVGKTGQPEFLNLAAELETGLEPGRLLESLLKIEETLGRRRGERWGPRTIDLDILYFGQRIVGQPDLIIPHPRAHQRAFVLEPLAELAPELVDPVTGKTIAEMLAGMDRRGQGVEKAAGLPSPLLRGEQGLHRALP